MFAELYKAGNVKLVQLLTNYPEVNLMAKTSQNKTPYECAKEIGYDNMAKTILSIIFTQIYLSIDYFGDEKRTLELLEHQDSIIAINNPTHIKGLLLISTKNNFKTLSLKIIEKASTQSLLGKDNGKTIEDLVKEKGWNDVIELIAAKRQSISQPFSEKRPREEPTNSNKKPMPDKPAQGWQRKISIENLVHREQRQSK